MPAVLLLLLLLLLLLCCALIDCELLLRVGDPGLDQLPWIGNGKLWEASLDW